MGRRNDAPSVRSYEVREDRDTDLERSYQLSPAMLAMVMGSGNRNLLASVVANVVEIVELFHHEPGVAHFDERYDRWTVKHFGRVLEPAIRCYLRLAIKATLALNEGGRRVGQAAQFQDYAEQSRWERAAVETIGIKETLARCRRIAELAGAHPGDGPYDMPAVPVGAGAEGED